jgi:hypothetical protein
MRHKIALCLALLVTGTLAAQERTRSPHGALKLECTACHRSATWTEVSISPAFDPGKWGFPLAGAHASTSCRACHQSLDFKGTSTSCVSCHADRHRGELGADCARCHTPRSFLDRTAMARAHQLTRFPLEGAHQAVDCTSCHTPTGQGGLQFVARSTDCVSCHKPDYLAVRSPDHVQGGFPQDCSQCHSSATWSRGRFNHDGTSFPLSGAHRAVGCIQCHTSGRYKGTPTQCVVCHQVDYNGTASPNHTSVGFSTDCVACHSTTSWTAAFDHSRTQFALTGAHKATTCTQCHADGVYAGKPTACVSCHQADYNTAAPVIHTLPSFGTTCTTCHTTTAWQPATFNHTTTAFPLTGMHLTAACDKCHVGAVYKGTATTCQACHLTDYTNAASPNHVQLGWPQTCITCHSGSTNTQAWDLGVTLPTQYHTMFDPRHEHAGSVCAQCHVTPDFKQSTCSNHHHPPSCTYLNRRSCD